MKIGIESNILRRLFENVYFINGTAYAGKSTMVRLLSEKYNGVFCGENYDQKLFFALDPAHQPNLCYFQTMSGWQEFLTRTPEAYNAWIEGGSRESAELEIVELLRRTEEGRPVFVDTNISPSILREISDYRRVAIMLSPQWMSVERFFDRSDPDKQFLFGEIQKADDPEAVMANFRRCIERINSEECYRKFAESGFFCHVRDENSTIENTLAVLEKHFGLVE